MIKIYLRVRIISISPENFELQGFLGIFSFRWLQIGIDAKIDGEYNKVKNICTEGGQRMEVYGK